MPSWMRRTVVVLGDAPIDLYDESPLRTNEIDDVPSDWGLPPELKTQQPPIAKSRPEKSLRIGGLFS